LSPSLVTETAALRALRWRARAPRVLVYALLAVLCLAGLRAAIAAPPKVPPAPSGPEPFDLGAGAFAETFAREYLSLDPERPELREARLRGYLADTLEPDAGLSGRRGRRVRWTTVLGQRREGSTLTVSVAAETGGELVYLAVPVARDRRGFLTVPAYPALVGPPATSSRADVAEEEEVADAGLRAVATRAVANYLAGEKRNLLADLSPEAVVSLPAERLRVRSTEEVTWVTQPRRAAVQVQAEGEAGELWTLRYELGVVRRDRWYVRSLAVDPTQRGELR
jgi:Conjugative transposon protein TcpC